MTRALACLILLAACTPEQAAKTTTAIQSACLISGTMQPVAVAVGTAAGGDAAKVAAADAAADAALIHPAVVAACAALGGVPVPPGP